jgi:hypothetical protein
MKSDPFVNTLNSLLQSALGTNPHGEALFKWIWSRDLDYKASESAGWQQTASGLFTPTSESTITVRMIDDDCWTLCQWLAPPSRAEWDAQLKGLIPYPQAGRYRPTDCVLPVRQKPTERITQYVIGSVRRNRGMTDQEIRDDVQASVDYEKEKFDKLNDDWIHDRWTDHVPGRKDWKSYASVDITKRSNSNSERVTQ